MLCRDSSKGLWQKDANILTHINGPIKWPCAYCHLSLRMTHIEQWYHGSTLSIMDLEENVVPPAHTHRPTFSSLPTSPKINFCWLSFLYMCILAKQKSCYSFHALGYHTFTRRSITQFGLPHLPGRLSHRLKRRPDVGSKVHPTMVVSKMKTSPTKTRTYMSDHVTAPLTSPWHRHSEPASTGETTLLSGSGKGSLMQTWVDIVVVVDDVRTVGNNSRGHESPPVVSRLRILRSSEGRPQAVRNRHWIHRLGILLGSRARLGFFRDAVLDSARCAHCARFRKSRRVQSHEAQIPCSPHRKCLFLAGCPCRRWRRTRRRRRVPTR